MELEEMRKRLARLEEFNERKKSLILNTLHDLKNPLAVIKSHADLLQEKLEVLLERPEDLREMLSAIVEAADTLAKKLEDFAEIARSQPPRNDI